MFHLKCTSHVKTEKNLIQTLFIQSMSRLKGGPPRLEEQIRFTQCVNSDANLIPETPQTHPEIIFNQISECLCCPVNLTHEITPHNILSQSMTIDHLYAFSMPPLILTSTL